MARTLVHVLMSLMCAAVFATAGAHAASHGVEAKPPSVTPKLKPITSAHRFAARAVKAGSSYTSSTHLDLLQDVRRFAEDKRCLAEAIYYEARAERAAGQLAVAEVVLNRVRSRHYPGAICEVVYQGQERGTGCQFSFVCDGSMDAPIEPLAWARAEKMAEHVLLGFSADRNVTGDATHYHADYVSPYWAGKLTPTSEIGAHKFYKGDTRGR